MRLSKPCDSTEVELWQARQKAQGGFSLMEVLLIIALMSAMILPFALLMSQTGDNARGAYLQSSRSILLNSIMDQATIERNTFVASYTTAMNSETTESGQVIPFRRMVDTQNAGASDTFKKTVYYYLYNNASDAANAPRYKTKQVVSRDVLRVRFDANQAAIVDASGQWWGCYNGYEAPNIVPGHVSAYSGAYNSTALVNLPSHSDMEIYQSEWYNATDLDYRIPVSNGLYTVKLYFKEVGHASRLLDLYLEGVLMNPGKPFNAFYACRQQHYCAVVQMFDVYVSDGVLNVQVALNAAAGHTNRNLSAISVKKRF